MSLIHTSAASTKSSLSAVQEGDIQPNAVDLRLGKIFSVSDNVFVIDEDHKKHRGSTEVEPDEDGYYVLQPGCYEVIMENQVTVGEGECGWVITRSTLNRNGIFITSGLYDSGYSGVMAGALHVTSGVAKIKQGTRIAQYICAESQSLHSYDGDYGDSKSHDEKYK